MTNEEYNEGLDKFYKVISELANEPYDFTYESLNSHLKNAWVTA